MVNVIKIYGDGWFIVCDFIVFNLKILLLVLENIGIKIKIEY